MTKVMTDNVKIHKHNDDSEEEDADADAADDGDEDDDDQCEIATSPRTSPYEPPRFTRCSQGVRKAFVRRS